MAKGTPRKRQTRSKKNTDSSETQQDTDSNSNSDNASVHGGDSSQNSSQGQIRHGNNQDDEQAIGMQLNDSDHSSNVEMNRDNDTSNQVHEGNNPSVENVGVLHSGETSQPRNSSIVASSANCHNVDVDGIQVSMTTVEFMQFRREERDRERREEREDRERREEREDREKREEREFELEKLRVEASAQQGSQKEERRIDRYQQKLTNQKDADQYFIAFEHFAKREGWEKSTWVRRVSQCMEGKALVAMNSVMTDDLDYDQMKSAILEVFQLSSENYRRKFRNTSKSDTENVKSFIMKLGHTFDAWMKFSDAEAISEDAKKISQLMIREQVFKKIPEDMSKHLMQLKVWDTATLASEAEDYASLDADYWLKYSGKQCDNRGQNQGSKGKNGGFKKRSFMSHDNSQGKFQDANAKFQGQQDQGQQGHSSKRFKPDHNYNKPNHKYNKPNRNQNQDKSKAGYGWRVHRCGQVQAHELNDRCMNEKFTIPRDNSRSKC